MQKKQPRQKRMPNFVKCFLSMDDWFSKYYFGHLLICFQPHTFMIGIVVSPDKGNGAIGILFGIFDIYWYFKKQENIEDLVN